MDKDYYKILGVPRDASAEDLKKAYRTLSKRWHPDMQQGKTDSEKTEAEERFKEINEAYSVLGDQEKRAMYDRFGSAEGMGVGSGGFDPMSFFRDHFADAFGGFGFGFGPSGGNRHRGPDSDSPKDGRNVKLSMHLSFEECLYGVNREFDVGIRETCQHCRGTGSDDGKFHDCPSCGGSGMITQALTSNFIQSTTCHVCGGTGRLPSKECHVCGGNKTVDVKHHIKIDVPMGVGNGDMLRVVGEGEHGINGGRNGDMFLVVTSDDGKVFKFGDCDCLHVDVIVPFFDFVPGKNVDVRTPWGTESVEIPKKPNPDGTYRNHVRGHGVRRKDRNGNVSAGDLLIDFIPEVPVDLDDSQVELMRKLSESLGQKNFPRNEKLNTEMDEFEERASKFRKN